MQFLHTVFPRTLSLGLALTSLCALGAITALPAAAQNLTYTLTNVTFDDGAVATGYFNFNPTTENFGTFDIVTTDGITDSVPGAHYLPPVGVPNQSLNANFFFVVNSPYQFLALDSPLSSGIVSPGVYALAPGTNVSPNGFTGSGESAFFNSQFVSRGVATGFLTVTPAVPEASTTVSFGLLLALGLGGVIVAAKRKKASSIA